MAICEKRHLIRAIKEGRICKNCGWMIRIVDWNKGNRFCTGCADAFKGVNVPYGHWPYKDEPPDPIER